jgi:L-lactate dehydrogenase complex protein LldG
MDRSQPADLPPIDPSAVRRVAPDDDLVSVFRARAESVGLRVSESPIATAASNVAALVQKIVARTDTDQRKVIVEPSLFLRPQLEELLSGKAELLDPRAGDAAMFAAQVAVTGVHAVVAETGSLVCASGRELWRGLTLIPPVHVAVVRARQIVPDLLDLFTASPPTEVPANLTLISGPSKTADIEGILITGVHGPGEVHVQVVCEST